MSVDGADTERPPRGSLRPLVIAAVAVAAAFALGAAVLSAAGHQRDQAAMPTTTMIAPDGVLDLATVPNGVATEFRFASAHLDEYRQLRCWCGCDRAFQHANLADCFVRSDGQWEAHGAGCAICLGEAAEARPALDSGTSPAMLAAALDTHWGTTTPVPPTTRGASR